MTLTAPMKLAYVRIAAVIRASAGLDVLEVGVDDVDDTVAGGDSMDEIGGGVLVSMVALEPGSGDPLLVQPAMAVAASKMPASARARDLRIMSLQSGDAVPEYTGAWRIMRFEMIGMELDETGDQIVALHVVTKIR